MPISLVGDQLPEILEPQERRQAIADMLELRRRFAKVDMPEGLIQQFATPPHSPQDLRPSLRIN